MSLFCLFYSTFSFLTNNLASPPFTLPWLFSCHVLRLLTFPLDIPLSHPPFVLSLYIFSFIFRPSPFPNVFLFNLVLHLLSLNIHIVLSSPAFLFPVIFSCLFLALLSPIIMFRPVLYFLYPYIKVPVLSWPYSSYSPTLSYWYHIVRWHSW